MKRNDIQYGNSRPNPTPHRIITSTHNTGQPIQYQILKSNDASSQNIQFAAYNTPQMTSAAISKSTINPPPTQVHVLTTGMAGTASSRHKNANNNAGPITVTQNVSAPLNVANVSQASSSGQQNNFQRLKVEDALSYLDQVKYKFGSQPQVYNDFLDIMKEFKSQTIDTPGVIQRVSNLFKGHPELIVGFNTFLPPGYKIEVQANDQGYAFQVSVSIPSPSGNVSVPTQASPQHKMQILQGSGSIVQTIPAQQTAVNLITTHGTHNQGLHIQPNNPQVQTQQPPQVSHITAMLPQNYTTRELERNIPTPSQQQQQQPQQHAQTAAPPQRHQTQASAQSIPSQQQNPSANSQAPHQLNHQIQQQQVQASHSPSDMAATVGSVFRISQPLQADQNQNQQPVEFNHAINYVNKIKNRFQNQPEKYKRFLEILHTYQREQRVTKDLSGNTIGDKLTETEVYSQVARLFDNQEDLLREFGQFLPDATSHPSAGGVTSQITSKSHNMQVESSGAATTPNKRASNLATLSATQNSKQSLMSTANRVERISAGSTNVGNVPNMNIPNNANADYHSAPNEREYFPSDSYPNNSKKESKNVNPVQKFPISSISQSSSSSGGIKRSPTYGLQHNNLGRGHNDRVVEPPIKRHKPTGYDVSLADAAKYGTLNDYAFFDNVRKALRSPDVYDNFLRCLTLYNQEIVSKSELIALVSPFLSKHPDLLRWFQDFLGPPSTPEGIPLAPAQRQDHRAQNDLTTEIDLSQCQKLGKSYRALPKSSVPKKCSGRTALCKEVLNDTWVSFPAYAEESTFVTSRKTQYEEFIYRCEDERFELDVVIETNSATIKVLEGVHKRLSRMSPEEVNRTKLDDTLGGTSTTIHQRALKRIYGDKAGDIIQGLKKNPMVAVPVVLRRLKAKEEEWREAQKGFNKLWREQNEKYYLKSLDHQGINFKQNDIKTLRSKSLLNEIEAIYDERNDDGPHLVLTYKDKSILEDAANLLIHHVKRQTGSQKQEKARIKHILRQFVPDLFFSPRQPMSDDEREDEVFPFSVDDRDDHQLDKKPSSANNDVLTSSNSSFNINNNNNNNNNNNPTLNEKNSKILDTDSENSSTKRKASNETSSSQQGGKENTNTSQLNSTSQSNPSGESKEENAQNSSNIFNPDIDIKQEIKEEEESPSKTKSKNFSARNLQHAASNHPDEAYTLFFGNNNWYLFFRLHAFLCERLLTIYERTKIMASEEEQHKSNRRSSTAVSLRLKAQSELEVPDYYPTFLELLKNLLDGNVDSTTYEDKLRDMYGIHAYITFTLDRVVSNAVRQLQHCVTERSALECVELYQLQTRTNGNGGLCRTARKRLAAELGYQRKAEKLLQEENCFKIFIYKHQCRVSIELLDNESEDATSNPVSGAQEWGTYVDRLTNPSHTANSIATNLFPKTPFLARNIRNFNKRNLVKIKAANEKLNADNNNKANTTSSNNEVPSADPTATDGKTNDSSVWGKNATTGQDKTGANSNISLYYVDDNQQIKLSMQTYKMILVGGDFGFYKKNSLRKAKQMHPKLTKSMHKRFGEFVQKWVNKNASEIQKMNITDWLLGRHQNDQVPNKTSVRRDNNINCTPYYPYNRYTVEFLNSNS